MAAKYDDMALPQGSDRDKMMGLYLRQVPGTENLYLKIGYFMRMRFWDPINALINQIKNAHSHTDYLELYSYMLNLMDTYIKTEETHMENRNNMIFNLNLIKSSFACYPIAFVNELRRCLQREQQLLTTHYGVDTDFSRNGFELPLFSSHSDQELAQDCQDMEQDDRVPCNPLGVDLGFLDQIEDEYFEMDKNLKVTEDLRSTCQGISHKVQGNQAGQSYSSAQATSDMLSLIHTTQHVQQRLKQPSHAFEESKHKLLNMLEASLECLKDIKNQYLCYQAQMEVGLLQKAEITPQICLGFDRFVYVLKKLYTRLESPPSKLEHIIEEYMKIALIVQEHPDGFTYIESEGGKKDGNEDNESAEPKKTKGKGAKSKEPKIFSTKKQSGMKARIEVLGGQHFYDFKVKYPSVVLITEDGHETGELAIADDCISVDFPSISFKDIKIQKHTRENGSNTRFQYVRLRFKITVSCFEREFTLETKTLPFNLVTGSVQALEFMGARMWYVFCNKNDMYSKCEVKDELDRDQVLAMLDQRVQSVSPGRTRSLSCNAKEFLLGLIPASRRSTSGNNTKITEHGFVKERICKTADKKDMNKNFSFFTWFYAFVNSIESYLLEPWLDNIISDPMTKEEAERLLYDKLVPPKTALIRPVRSFVASPNCKSANIKLAIEIKLRIGNADEILVTNTSMDDIREKGLLGAMKTIVSKNTTDRLIDYILSSKQEIVPLAKLKKYPKTKCAAEEYHECIMERVAMLHLQVPERTRDLFPRDLEPFDADIHVKRRKTSRQNSTANSSSYGSPASTSYELSPIGRSTDEWSLGNDSNGTASAFSPVGLQKQNCSDDSSVKVESPTSTTDIPFSATPSSANCSTSKWANIGPTQVDVTNIEELKKSCTTHRRSSVNLLKNTAGLATVAEKVNSGELSRNTWSATADSNSTNAMPANSMWSNGHPITTNASNSFDQASTFMITNSGSTIAPVSSTPVHTSQQNGLQNGFIELTGHGFTNLQNDFLLIQQDVVDAKGLADQFQESVFTRPDNASMMLNGVHPSNDSGLPADITSWLVDQRHSVHQNGDGNVYTILQDLSQNIKSPF